ncbi:MAG: glycosyltransferase family 4 protein [Parcubacteria group bacterium]
MKILLINKFHYLRGGSERVYFQTKEVLEKNGHQVVCFSMKDGRNVASGQEKYFADNVDLTDTKNVIALSGRLLYNKEVATRLEKLIIDEKPDIAHLHNFAHQLTPAILKPLKKHKIPIVQTLHDLQIICPNYSLLSHGEICERCRKHKYYQCVLHVCVRGSFRLSMLAALELYGQWVFKYYREKIDLFISPSDFLKNKLIDWGVDQPIETVNNFVDLKKLTPNYAAGEYLVYVGRLSPEKGLRTLLKAMIDLPSIPLKIIGDGPMRDELIEFIAENDLKHVEMCGLKSGDELFALIKNSRILILPSECYENYPMVAIEALALGKPILTTRLGGIPEIVTDNLTGWFFEAGNVDDLREKIQIHFNDIEKLETAGRAGRAGVERRNSEDKYYRKLMECYEMVRDEKVAVG